MNGQEVTWVIGHKVIWSEFERGEMQYNFAAGCWGFTLHALKQTDYLHTLSDPRCSWASTEQVYVFTAICCVLTQWSAAAAAGWLRFQKAGKKKRRFTCIHISAQPARPVNGFRVTSLSTLDVTMLRGLYVAKFVFSWSPISWISHNSCFHRELYSMFRLRAEAHFCKHSEKVCNGTDLLCQQ